MSAFIMAPLLVPAVAVAVAMPVVVLAAFPFAVVATVMGVVAIAMGLAFIGIFLFLLSPIATATYMLWRHFRQPAAPVEVSAVGEARRCD